MLRHWLLREQLSAHAPSTHKPVPAWKLQHSPLTVQLAPVARQVAPHELGWLQARLPLTRSPQQSLLQSAFMLQESAHRPLTHHPVPWRKVQQSPLTPQLAPTPTQAELPPPPPVALPRGAQKPVALQAAPTHCRQALPPEPQLAEVRPLWHWPALSQHPEVQVASQGLAQLHNPSTTTPIHTLPLMPASPSPMSGKRASEV